jgi:hypothetical protein
MRPRGSWGGDRLDAHGLRYRGGGSGREQAKLARWLPHGTRDRSPPAPPSLTLTSRHPPLAPLSLPRRGETRIELHLYFQLLRPGGLLMGDDYQDFPAVRADVDEFVS